jgi:predicted GNAT family acetyltransferase
MDEVKLNVDEKGAGAFYVVEGAEQVAEMAISISGGNLIVYHTEVSEKFEGKGLAKKLLGTMVDYAKSHELKVIALCPYVHAQFKRHPELYSDIWNRDVERQNEI